MARPQAPKLDLNRGVRTRFHASGMKVCMYVDDPGVYMTEGGQPLDVKFAREAGFDVEKDLRQRAINQRMAEYRRKLEEEARSEEDALAQAASDRSNYRVQHIGAGQYAIFDKGGKRLTRVAMTKADVELLVGPIDADPNDPNSMVPSALPDVGENPSANLDELLGQVPAAKRVG